MSTETRPGFMTPEELKAAGYRLDNLGQVRSSAGELVCGLSSRRHEHHLLPLSAPQTDGTVRDLWVDEQALEELTMHRVRIVVSQGRKKLGRIIIGRLRGLIELLRGILGG